MIPRAIALRRPWRESIRTRLHAITCWWHRLRGCKRCRILSTDDGIGGQCMDCGRIHGWVSRAELRVALRGPIYDLGFVVEDGWSLTSQGEAKLRRLNVLEGAGTPGDPLRVRYRDRPHR